ncbi:MAG: hypothetical protein M1504_03855 [Candidatus Marsarchaeota archaeon]|nr:hypothetical protein [Candidatus Marsarchaeota archaeon]
MPKQTTTKHRHSNTKTPAKKATKTRSFNGSKAANARHTSGSKPTRPSRPTSASRMQVRSSILPKGTAKSITGKVAAAGKETDNHVESKSKKAMAYKYTPEEVTMAIGQLSQNNDAADYLKKNVSKRALDVINMLNTPKTDEALAEELDLKINAVRRILNIMQGYGITNYYIAKNVNGWLSFAWYLNVDKFSPFFEYVNNLETSKPLVNDQCNDYFVCSKCYDQTKLVFTFDAAFEGDFRCTSCGAKLDMIDRNAATKLTTTQEVSNPTV